MKIQIKLMADYFCYPLWWNDGVNTGDINPDDLPISAHLKHKLEIWSDLFDSILDMNNPAISDFATPKDEDDFVQTGYELCRELQQELGGKYEIHYVPIK